MMNHLDLFSGIGGFAYAAQQVWGEEHNIVAFVEKDKYCQKVLNKHWPEVPIFDDIKEFRYDKTEAVDLLTGGFPCQPFSVAGKRKGKSDDRYLWPEMFRVIQEAKPTWIIGENVPGIINMGLETTVLDLEAEGYEVELLVLPACGVGAWHQRYRVWIIAHNARMGRQEGAEQTIRSKVQESEGSESEHICKALSNVRIIANSNTERLQRSGETGNISSKGQDYDKLSARCSENAKMWSVEPNVGRVANGIPNRVDRLKGLGNAIVPQCVMPIMWAIKKIEKK